MSQRNSTNVCTKTAMLIAVFVGLVAVGCDKSESNSGITGTVEVQGASGDSVVVKLYERPDTESESSVWSIPAQHSSVGFTYRTENVFEHRVLIPYRTDTTGSDGRFSFNDLNDGDYIVVADGQTPNFGNSNYKEDYGWSRPRGVRVDGSEQDVGVLKLYPDTVLGITNISSPVTVPAGRHWVLTGNVFIGSGGSLTVEAGAVLRIGTNISVRVTAGGQLTCNGTADDNIIFTTNDIFDYDPQEWASLRFSVGAESPQISHCRFEFAQTAIVTESEGGRVEYCFFHRLNEALRSSGHPPVFDHNVIRKAGLGFHCGNGTDIDISSNVFQTCDPFSITLDGIEGGKIYNNWFRDGGGSDTSSTGERGVLRLEWMSDLEVYQNSIETSWFALTLRSGVDSTVYIHHNTFDRIHKVLYVGVTNDRLRYSSPVFRYNCLSSVDEYFAHYLACDINSRVIYAENNYWSGITNTLVLRENHMWDCVNQPVEPPCPCFQLDPVLATCGEIQGLTGTPAGILGD